jgi:hypothetical protein
MPANLKTKRGFSIRSYLCRSILLPSLLFLAAQAAFGAPGLYDVRDHGARGDGLAPDTAAINRAVAACAGAGGGQVRFPPGRYLSGTVRLRNKVTLHLEAGATLIGTPNLADYEQFSPPAGVFEATFKPSWHRALVLGVGVDDVAIEGDGAIDGNKVRDPAGEERMRGPHTILFGQSKGIAIRGVTIRDSANYAVLLEDCSQVVISGLVITGGWDGIHFRGWPEKPCRGKRTDHSRLSVLWPRAVSAPVLRPHQHALRCGPSARRLGPNDRAAR